MTRYNCKTAKTISIVHYLEQCGIHPQKIKGNNYWYLSPIREERTPSFKVNTKLNSWMDFGEGIGGNLIDLGIRLHDCSVEGFLARLNHGNYDLSVHQQLSLNIPVVSETPVIVRGVNALQHPALFSYLEGRGINRAHAIEHCKEIDFSIAGRPYFAIGFPNRSGGYELRNKWSKLAAAPKDISIIENGFKAITVVEGFTDFLSLLQLYQAAPQTDFLVLNSVSLVEKAVPVLKGYAEVFLMLNHDVAGQKAAQRFRSAGIDLTDASGFYQGFNDINEYLVKQPKQDDLQQQRTYGIGR